jgi:acetolactate synthase-1/2/3 large subunit
MGFDAVHFNYEYNSGFIGSYGNRYGNFTLANADVVLVLGSRLDLKQIGAHPELFARHAKIIQVDIDENELKKNDLSKITIHSDIKTFLKYMNELNFDLDIHDWRNQIKVWKSKYPTSKKRDGKDNVPNILVEKIFDHLTERDRISIDVGQHQMWVAQAAKIRKDQRLFFSGGLGAMGFALPCAIGLSITGGRAVVISGDGGFQMNIQEMEVIKRRNLPIKIIIMNNENLAMVRQFQELYMNANFPSTVKDYSAPNFAAVAQAYGIRSLTIKHDSIDHQFLSNFFADNTPALLDIRLDRFTQVEPKLLFGNPIENLSPLLSEQELKTNMVSE